ncbi:hypothetical protein CONPUDRAFT_163171 [Coniophora puteana RWD-64-598 SS2]|uniref:Uncharacterized protein n=1 Tax=Coniophora puteana (strain RWD-64-598) TaxID=741705 RepID=A0A5M3MZ49_CONPW|nr:uncharacterized protein CONPUDRAFT_163171 [Coniophora puteana RWD-64-598 SS2]EIW83915.1 hypothetical protein CONPUDRAFT_163171 [Coniophora puteana RWD-64-598 SS2]
MSNTYATEKELPPLPFEVEDVAGLPSDFEAALDRCFLMSRQTVLDKHQATVTWSTSVTTSSDRHANAAHRKPSSNAMSDNTAPTQPPRSIKVKRSFNLLSRGSLASKSTPDLKVAVKGSSDIMPPLPAIPRLPKPMPKVPKEQSTLTPLLGTAREPRERPDHKRAAEATEFTARPTPGAQWRAMRNWLWPDSSTTTPLGISVLATPPPPTPPKTLTSVIRWLV